MLKQNDFISAQYPIHVTGGGVGSVAAFTNQNSSIRVNWMPTEVQMNRNFSGCGFDQKSSLYLGYNGEYAIIQSMSNSGLTSSTGLAGAGTLTASAVMKGPIGSTIAGSGAVSSGYAYGYNTGSISATIAVNASLSAGAVAGAVLGTPIDGSYNVEQVLKIVAAVTGGLVSGGPTNPAFTDLSQTHTVVTGTVDVDGNRSAVTLNP